jgi:hypothetical protein
MTIKVLSEAKAELLSAVAYYEKQQGGLGKRLWVEVHRHVMWIAQNSELPRLRPGGYRRVNLRIFPYYIAYLIRGTKIWILAIAHIHREPEYWVERKRRIG